MIVRSIVDLHKDKISMYSDGVGMGVPPPWRFLSSVVLRLKEIRMKFLSSVAQAPKERGRKVQVQEGRKEQL